jgi:hypothetical protein
MSQTTEAIIRYSEMRGCPGQPVGWSKPKRKRKKQKTSK